VSELATGQLNSSPAVDATETLMVFGSLQQGVTAGVDVYSTTRASASALWGPSQPVPGVNGPADDVAPFVAQGGLVIFFASTRGGNSDLFYSARRSTDQPFPNPVPLTDLNSPSYESDPTLSPDLTYMMFTSSRTGSTALYEARAMR
jgi:Tol biopolymer transport system component